MFNQLANTITADLLNIITAVIILVIGWIVALLVSAVVRGAIRRTKLSEYLSKLSEDEEGVKTLDLERWVSKLTFYLVFFFALIAFFKYLNLEVVAEPFSGFLNQIFNYLPMFLGAIFLIFIAWIVATVLRIVILRLLTAVKIDERLGEQTGLEEGKETSLSQFISKVAYWLVLLLFLPAILTALQLEGLLQPVQGMIASALAFMPNILAAALIIAVGWVLARILQRIVTAMFSSVGLDTLSENVGMARVMGEQKLSKLLGMITYALVLIVAIIAALNALALEAVTQPASNMLDVILGALPDIFAALLVLVIAFIGGHLVKGLLVKVLNAAGFNNILSAIGIKQEPVEGKWTPSEAVGYISFVIIMIFATIEAAELLGFALLANLVSQLLVFISHIILGLVILGIALYLAKLAQKAIEATGAANANILAPIAKYSIVLLGGAMALQRMGLANEIIILAFGLVLGTAALSTILAIGLGGRDIAARELEKLLEKYRNKE